MDPELKSLLTVLIDKVERIDATLQAVQGDVHQLKGDVHQLKGDVHQLKNDVHQLKNDMVQVKDEQRQMKEMLGVVRLKEIGRLDGRIDQLAQDVALGRNPNAA